jgi:hypothetical protein
LTTTVVFKFQATTLDDTHAWMSRSLNYLKEYGIFPQVAGKHHPDLLCRSIGRSGEGYVTDAKL